MIKGLKERIIKKTISIMLVLAAEVVKAHFTFGAPFDTNLGAPYDTSKGDGNPDISAESLLIFFSSYRSMGYGSSDIYVAERATISDPWGTATNIGSPVNSSAYEGSPTISSDGLCIYFTSDRSGGSGNRDLWVSMQPTRNDTWGEPINLGSEINSPFAEGDPEISPDQLMILFNSNRSGGYGEHDLYVTSRATISDPWGTPVNIGPAVNSPGYDGDPELSFDGLTLFYGSYRGGGHGLSDLWMTTRLTASDAWASSVNLGPIVNGLMQDSDPTISPDGSTLYFSRRITRYDIRQTQIVPIVDLNNDGIVDSADMVIMVDNWGTESSLCDIGLMPWGDGIVDVEDLIVLAEHLFEEVPSVE